ncbi:MAG TPA: AAA family ATPase [Vicinamibacterales bacterium]|nr:AAA family ATPase [Vicinamibacterales bacterium]
MSKSKPSTDNGALRGHLVGLNLEPYLRHIRFPRYRNLVDGTRIDFTFPITAIVGQNGTNKTSVLRAVQGCPDYENIGNYWFDTPLDPIKGEERPRFIHGWVAPSTKQVVESVKQREPSGPADYFEPARPRDGMRPMERGVGVLNSGRGSLNREERSQTRWNAINKNVEYIDFRSELSAFDKYFHHNNYLRRRDEPRSPSDPLPQKKSFIRRRSQYLKRSIEGGAKSNKLGTYERILTSASNMDSEQVQHVSDLLGRDYTRIRLIEHRFFDVPGWTALLGRGNTQYSEAWAGSGEFAVVQLVRVLTTCEPGSLVILDEPEVSLHPLAQKRLVLLLRSMVATRNLQIVMSTHSPTLIETLPADAIKVLQLRDDGQVELRSQTSEPNEAFVVLGNSFERPTIYVEDRLAKAIVHHALASESDQLAMSVDIRIYPGGSSSMATRAVATWALAASQNLLVLLDGDARTADTRTPDQVPDSDLAEYVKHIARGMPYIDMDSGSDPRIGQRIFANWWACNVRFLPGSENPESLLLAMTDREIRVGDAAKQAWRSETENSIPTNVDSEAIYQQQLRALNSVPRDHPQLDTVRSTLRNWLANGEHP